MTCIDRPTLSTLGPGDVAVGLRGDRLETLLGSCVAIVLTDPRRSVGVMCHIVHRERPDEHAGNDTAYAGAALQRMCELLRARGIVPQLCEAYVYGGGNMFPGLTPPLDIGELNAAWAIHALRAMGVRILALDVAGTVYRRLQWTVGPAEPQVSAMPVETRA